MSELFARFITRDDHDHASFVSTTDVAITLFTGYYPQSHAPSHLRADMILLPALKLIIDL